MLENHNTGDNKVLIMLIRLKPSLAFSLRYHRLVLSAQNLVNA